MNSLFKILFASIFLLLPSLLYSEAKAGNFIQFQKNNVQVLRGHSFELGEKQRTIVTLEHYHAHQYGDTLFWIDLIKPDGQDHTYYTEIAPRLSLGKVTGRDLSIGPIKDFLISTVYEKAKDQGPQYLYGVAADLDISGFKFFKVNAYIHDSTELDGQTWQVTIAWNRPFEINGTRFLTEGFADFEGGEADRHSNQLIVPRLLWDASDVIGAAPGTVMAGLEYQYWHNKFGIKGVTESVPQAQIKWSF